MIGEWDDDKKEIQGEFTFTDEEFLDIVNRILKTEVELDTVFVPLTSMEDSFNLQGMDSLSVMMFFVWIMEFFGIPEVRLEGLTSQPDFTIATLKAFVMAEATRTFTYKEGMECSERCL